MLVYVSLVQRCVTSVDTYSVFSRAGYCGMSDESMRRLKAEFDDRFDLVSHFSVVIVPVTSTNYY